MINVLDDEFKGTFNKKHTRHKRLNNVIVNVILAFLLTFSSSSIFAISDSSTLSPSTENQEKELFKAIYKGKLSGFRVTLTRTLTAYENDRYTLTSIARNGFASISESSRFYNTSNYFVTSEYDYKRSVLGNKSKKNIRFDWKKNKAYYRREDKPSRNTDHDISIGMLDPSLYQLKLQKDLHQEKQKLEYQYIKLTRIDNMKFELDKKQIFKFKNKELEALRYKRIREDAEKQTYVTVIPELGYQIAEITHIDENGKPYTLTLKDLNYDEQALEKFYMR